MDRRFLRYYEDELQFLRDLGGEFAEAHPNVAGRLGLDSFACADPYVERLLEGAAFLAARVQLKMDAEFPRFTEHLLELLYPDYLAPTPAMAIVAMTPDLSAGNVFEGPTVPRGTRLLSKLGPRMQTRCILTTAHDVELWPIKIAEARYLSGNNLTAAGLARGGRAQAGMLLRLETLSEVTFADLAIDRLTFYLAGDRSGHRLYENLFAQHCGIVAKRAEDKEATTSRRPMTLRPRGFETEEALLPCPPTGYDGYRLLREYFAFPERYRFAEITGIQAAMPAKVNRQLDIIVLFDRYDAELEDALTADDIVLFATPAVNLFQRNCEPITLDPKQREHHVVVDRVRPMDYEVHSLIDVTGDGGANVRGRRFAPLFSFENDIHTDGGHYTIERRPRALSARHDRREVRLSNYQGSEVFLRLMGVDTGAGEGELKRLHLRALCTNRDLAQPGMIPLPVGESHFSTESGAPIAAIRCVGEISRPRPSLAQGEPIAARAGQRFGRTPWHLISHLSLNYLSIVDGPDGEGAASLRELLGLYAAFAEPGIAKQVEGVRHVESQPITDRMPIAGPISFGRGLEIKLDFDETLFDGGSAFLLGAVLEQFFRRHISINSFVKTRLSTGRGELMRWPARIGQRHLM
ncbi:MAG: type VI secretion system baseplate subunit TssF [Pseudomonadota bacterium]